MAPPRQEIFGFDAKTVAVFFLFLAGNFGMNELLTWAMHPVEKGGAGYSFPIFEGCADTVSRAPAPDTGPLAQPPSPPFPPRIPAGADPQSRQCACAT